MRKLTAGANNLNRAVLPPAENGAAVPRWLRKLTAGANNLNRADVPSDRNHRTGVSSTAPGEAGIIMAVTPS